MHSGHSSPQGANRGGGEGRDENRSGSPEWNSVTGRLAEKASPAYPLNPPPMARAVRKVSQSKGREEELLQT